MAARIYVQVPAYRDPELLPTLVDLFDKAARPDALRVAVAWQHGKDEVGLERRLSGAGRVELLKIPAENSLGCNWARLLLQRRWDGEEYTLFLDSHHRFVPGWDDTLVRMYDVLRHAGVDQPLLTAYLPPYDPVSDPVSDRAARVEEVYRLDLAERRDGLMFRLEGHPVAGWRGLEEPMPARFVSLHLLFTHGHFNAVLPMDPEIYFFADEVAVALRAFTHGYDLFHPHVVLGWHCYDRRTRGTHWADHSAWRQQQSRSMARVRRLYAGEHLGADGLGDRRTVADFETLVGRSLIGQDGVHTSVGG